LPATRINALAAAGLLLLLQACSSAPATQQSAPESAPEAVPEITLNLPEQAQDCACVVTGEADYTFLDKGFNALVAGDHIEAVQYFQRYQRLESSPQANWEAGIAIAYDSMLPDSPFYDPAAARTAYGKLKDQQVGGVPVHTKALMMRDALKTFVAMEQQINDLESDNALLRQDLEKREEALKRLRELTLGQ
jgi:hypothetical protein